MSVGTVFNNERLSMKTFPYFFVATAVSFFLTYSVFAAASDEQGVERWMAQQTSALAALASVGR